MGLPLRHVMAVAIIAVLIATSRTAPSLVWYSAHGRLRSAFGPLVLCSLFWNARTSRARMPALSSAA